MAGSESKQIELSVRDASGKEKSTRSVSDKLLAAKTDSGILHQVVRWQRARKRAGTHSVQTRAEMTGGGAKPWKQKGTGRARAGSNTSPLWVGGGIAHGPKPRDYDFSINKKEKKAALRAALTSRFQSEGLIVVEDFGLKEVSTASAVKTLKKLGVKAGATTLVVLEAGAEKETKSLRNIKGVKLVNPAGLNTYDVLNAASVVFTAAAFDQAEKSLA